MRTYPIPCPLCCRGYLKTVKTSLTTEAWECENCKKIYTDREVGVKRKYARFNPSSRNRNSIN